MNALQVKIIHAPSTPQLEEKMNEWLIATRLDITVIKISYTHTQASFGAAFVAYIEYK